MADERVKQAVSAFKAGRKAEARTILESVVEEDQGNEEAWLYLSALVDTLEEQEICLENVLALNPDNQKAKQGLESVRQKLKKSPPSAGSTPTQATMPFGSPASPPPVGAGFEVSFGDSPFGSVPDAEASFGFDFDAAAAPPPAADQAFDWFSGSSEPPAPPDSDSGPDAYSVPTSVDWGRDDKPAVYGSGQDVEMPSAQEWDSWMEGLNIGQDASDAPAQPDVTGSSSSPFVLDDSAPFGETSYMVDDDTSFMDEFQPAASTPQEVESEPFGSSSAWASPFGDEATPDDQPAEETFSSFGIRDSVSPAFAAEPFTADVPFTEESSASDPFTLDTEIGAEDFDFSFGEDEEDEEAGPALQPARAGKAAVPKAARSVATPSADDAKYFRLIPDEIDAKTGGIEPRSLMMLGGIVILLVLNVVSFMMLL